MVMATSVRSFSKINLGLAIGPVRPDGFHGLTTMYQTLALHDVVTVSAVRSNTTGFKETRIALASNHPWVPPDARNTAWRMVEKCLKRLGISAEVKIRIQKNLPVQGGMGAGSANAAAALIGLERELGVALPGPERLELAAEIGSDVPLFLLGGAVLGLGRGEQVVPLPDLPETWCVVAMPELGVSTPQAFRDWDALVAASPTHAKRPHEWGTRSGGDSDEGLTRITVRDTLNELSCALASTYAEPGTSGIFCNPGPNQTTSPERLEKKRDGFDGNQSIMQDDLAESTLLSLARTGIENDFERVVFPIHPSLREIKRQLKGIDLADSNMPGADSSGSVLAGSAIYAALSGSGSALFGLYRSEADAKAAQQRVQAAGCKAITTQTLPRAAYWRTMFAG
jgi:4-diphosphocytidyl-2-C-methyl-D-erythritol kinase